MSTKVTIEETFNGDIPMADPYSKQKILSTLRINVKSLAAESKFIRHEVKKVNKSKLSDNDKGILQSSLDYHRRYDVRTQSRITQLALASVRGVPYERVEANAKVEPNWTKIYKKVKKHLNESCWRHEPSILKTSFEWCEEGKRWYQEKNSGLKKKMEDAAT